MTSFFQDSVQIWTIVLVVLIPLTVVVLGEAIERLRRNDQPLEVGVRHLRNYFMPALGLFLLLVTVFELPRVQLGVRLVETVAWLSGGYALILILRLVFRRSEDESTWRGRVPQLLLQLPRLLVIFVVATSVLNGVWSVDLSGFATALGVGSLVIALALQDTLSGLVSGVLLVADRPFNNGDWIKSGDLDGRVIDIKWRTARIQTREGNLITVPNGTLANAEITNFSQPTPLQMVRVPFDAAFSNPPNSVKQMAIAAAAETAGVVADPPPMCAVTRLDDPVMGYETRLWIEDHAEEPAIRNAYLTKLWYRSVRDDIALPSPAFDLFHHESSSPPFEEPTEDDLEDIVRSIPIFAMSDEETARRLARRTELRRYGSDEWVIGLGEHFEGLFVVVDGEALLQVDAGEPGIHEVVVLVAGDVFGLMTTLSEGEHPVGITARGDLAVAKIEEHTAADAIRRDARVSVALNRIVEERQAALLRVLEELEVGPDGDPVIALTEPDADDEVIDLRTAEESEPAAAAGSADD